MDADAIQHRIERARALAAAHQLGAAASELESLRTSIRDTALRNITSLMLMGIYLEDANYVRAQAILEEAFLARSAQKDDSIRTYFALAGQAINGVRSHLARYRTFGINPSDSDLPPEAITDLDRLRNLLERMISQSKEITDGDALAYDALALQEDVLGIRLSLAQDGADREKWQAEYTGAREKLASAQVQVASIGRLPSLGLPSNKVSKTGTPEQAVPLPSNPAPETARQSQPASDPAGGAVLSGSNGSDAKTITTGSLNGRENKRVTPGYPAIAKAAAAHGVVRVYVIVDEKGKVAVTKSEGPTLLRQTSEDAARAWGFPPTIIDGKPVRVSGYIDFEFKL
jgi:TonB family protein